MNTESQSNAEQTPTIKWTGWRHAGGPYYHAQGIVTSGIELMDRGDRPVMVAVDKPGDHRLKLFVAGEPRADTLRVRLMGAGGADVEPLPLIRVIEGGYVAQGRWADSVSLAAALGLVRSFATKRPPPDPTPAVRSGPAAGNEARGVVDLTKPAPKRDRTGVPVPTEPGKFPRALWCQSKRHGCMVMSRWIGRIPEQFHRARGAPVLEIAGGTTVRAYGTHVDAVPWTVNGEVLRFMLDLTYRSAPEDRYICPLPPERIEAIRTYEPPAKRWKPPVLSEQQIAERIEKLNEARGGEYLDVCVETRFAADPKADYLPWRGSVADWPDWMQARSVTVSSPADTGGGGRLVVFDAPGLKAKGYPTIRLNNVWLVTGPFTGESAAGYCDPVELDEIRMYGQGMDAAADITLPNEPARIRTMGQVSALHRLLRGDGDKYGPGLPGRAFRPWREDAMQINNAFGAMMMGVGQAAYNRGQEQRCGEAADRLEGRVKRLYDRRKPAYADYDLEGWLAEQADGKHVKPHAWTAQAAGLREDVVTCRERAERLEATVTEWRAKYDAAIGRIETLEDEWADLIQVLYPAA